ncbi:MAG TPA: glycosyltransferase [Candidatus Polarisedimenticolia bacterium]|jgi:cellulose synthase/poly-beta-1,6-N-acetylglucosamine synthase-like glycosyltransferase|nr:glycosyltransferase [Candidatus Polarisedimenticolia bacterium]
MFLAHRLVQIVEAQSICFAWSWSLVYLFGHRLRRGHWLVSLIYLAALEGGAFWLVDYFSGPAPAPVYWIPVGLIALLTVVPTEHWNVLGQACMASTLALGTHFLMYIVLISVRSHLGPLSLFFSLGLLALQTFAVTLLCAGSFEILDVLCRIRWRRVADPQPVTDWSPRVSIHVPAYNEPPEMVIETLDALSRLDYPDYEVVVIDDNTTEERLWKPVEEHCRKLGFKFFHLENWPGFKSGALNFALSKTDPAAEIVGVVDSDYVVEPDYLRRCVGFFRNPSVAFVQTPQDYRDVAPDDRYATACYDAYLYFFRISMTGRNEHNAIIFAGTMGLIRRRILELLGGWDEWCITEDAEISLRILDRGYEGVYVERSFGHGLMPLNFEGLKKQRFRWAFGGMQILRRHWMALLPLARWRDPSHRLTFAQQWDYLMGGLQWLNDPLTFAFTVLLLFGATAVLVAHSLLVQPMAPAVLFVPFLFVFIGFSRFLWALRVRVGCGMTRAISAFTILLGLTWVVTVACVLGLVKQEGVFLRTPKKRSATDRWHIVRVVSREIGLAGLCLLAAGLILSTTPRAPHVWVMAGLLLWQSLIYVSAPISSFWGHQSELRVMHPEYLSSPRTTGQRFSSMITDRRIAWGLAGLVVLGALVFYLAVTLAPEEERIFRTNPERLAFIPEPLMHPPPETLIKAVQYFEKEAALKGNVEGALALWDPHGVVRDENYTPSDPTDDKVWVGLDGVRRRYTEEFAARRYLSLAHTDASVIIEGDRAVIVNDLQAVIRTPNGIQRVYLSRGDRWTLTRGDKGWRISELVVNRAPR